MRLILASRSPRRLALLAAHGFRVEVHPAAIDETRWQMDSPTELAETLAQAKAKHVASERPNEKAPILAADTIVAIDGEALGQPRSTQHAAQMLQRLSDRVHEVITGVAVWHNGRLQSSTCITKVRFRKLAPEEIAAYIASGEPMDKAGAYGAQGGGASFIIGIEGPLDNVIGLPMQLVRRLLP